QKYGDILNNLGVKKDCRHPPYITYIKEQIRVIAANIGNVVFICVANPSTLIQSISDAPKDMISIVNTALDEISPSGYVWYTNYLGLAPLARTILMGANDAKIILCGHSTGGAVAHVAHYSLISNRDYNFGNDKVISVAFGSTPFLWKSNCDTLENKQFVTYFDDQDIVPALFLPSIAKAQASRYCENSNRVAELSKFVGANFHNIMAHISEQEFKHYGVWIKLTKGLFGLERNQTDLSDHFRSEVFNTERTIQDISNKHSMANVYRKLKTFFNGQVPTSQNSATLNFCLREATAKCLATDELGPKILPCLLNTAIAGAVVTKRFGDNTIFNTLVKFKNDCFLYRLSLHDNVKCSKNDKSYDTTKNAEEDSAPWVEMLDRLSKIKPEGENTNDIMDSSDEFNHTNISTNMNSLAIHTAILLGLNHYDGEKGTTILKYAYPVAMGVVGVFGVIVTGGAGLVAGFGTYAVCTGGFVAADAAIISGISLGFAGASIFSGCEAYQAFSQAFRGADQDHFDLGIQVRLESYQEASDHYTRHLEYKAKSANIKVTEPKDATVNEMSIIAIDAPVSLSKNSRKLWNRFVPILRGIVELRKLCKNLVFIVVNGNQGVGKSWFIQSLRKVEHGSRVSTDYPSFYPYSPHQNTDAQVYIIDLPGSDSVSDKLRQYVKELFGIGSIGINLFQFDTRPQQLDREMLAMRNMFNGCSDVLICLNKVMSVPLNMKREPDNSQPLLSPILEKWTDYFEQNGVMLSGKNPKYHLMAIDMAGTNELPPFDDGGDEEEYQQECVVFERKVKRNLDILTVNGGKSRQDVVNWIDEKVKLLIKSRTMN
ncbi:hypothetical protein THRCLA_00641, partial [Thraustotheca clavata]